MPKTKIVATLGPASKNLKIMENMLKNGLFMARLNFSHGSHSYHAYMLKKIRKASAKTGKPVKVIQDLQGLKIRVSGITQPLKVKKGQTVVLGKDFFLDSEIAKYVKPGQTLFIEDGLLEFNITKVKNSQIYCKSVNGGLICSRKGVNLPNALIPGGSLTKKDLEDLSFAVKNKVDFVAISFVNDASDILNLKTVLKQKFLGKGQTPKIIAKIEKPQAVTNINKIIGASDMVMVARGDLGVEMNLAHIPTYQKMIIEECRRQKKPVIVATHMLESMIQNPRPTRAEVSDVANAVLDGANFLMLSGETAVGKHPEKAVEHMQRVIEAAENSIYFKHK